MITAVVLITAERGALPKVGEDLAAVQGVSEVYSVTGEIDFVAMVRARSDSSSAPGSCSCSAVSFTSSSGLRTGCRHCRGR
jgi:hypothetical protein